MEDKIITYREMCDNENMQTIQRGMNYRLNPNYSVILMSQRKNAPYNDKICNDGVTVEYEGHDCARSNEISDPKVVDQPRKTKTGKLTQNGHFLKAVEDYKNGLHDPEAVKVYEKIFSGVWSEKGFFKLIDSKYEKDSKNRYVFIFVLEKSEYDLKDDMLWENILRPRSRIIPSHIKMQVWKRDKGKCVICGATDDLHFDHDLPYSKGGSSITADNVRILCARHNLQKSNKIE